MSVSPKVTVESKDLGWREFFKRAREIVDMQVHVGVLADSSEGNIGEDKDGEAGGLTLAEIATIMELGTEDGHVPARSFLRATFEAELDTLVDMGEKLVADVLDGKLAVEKALGVLGAHLVKAMRQRIQSGIAPPNAPSTALAKGKKGRTAKFFKKAAKTLGQGLAQAGVLAAVKPLIDTGRLINALSWAVARRGGSEHGADEE